LHGIYTLHNTLIDKGIDVYEKGADEYEKVEEVPLPKGV
jgi:hypothetical protein